MPIHPIGEKLRKGEFGSPYAVRDCYAVDPNYGTMADFKGLVAEAHRRGMKVIMDLVADHTAWDSVMMQHPEFYKQDENGKSVMVSSFHGKAIVQWSTDPTISPHFFGRAAAAGRPARGQIPPRFHI